MILGMIHKMTDPIVLYGTGGAGRTIASIIEQMDQFELKGFLDDDSTYHQKRVAGYPVLGGQDWLEENENTNLVLGIGDSEVRAELTNSLLDHLNMNLPQIIHPHVTLLGSIEFIRGTVIYPNVTVGPSVTFGESCLVNLNTSISHDSELGDYVTLAPGVNICGNVTLESKVSVGTNAAILPGIQVGQNACIGAGATVTENVPSNTTVIGTPAREYPG